MTNLDFNEGEEANTVTLSSSDENNIDVKFSLYINANVDGDDAAQLPISCLSDPFYIEFYIPEIEAFIPNNRKPTIFGYIK